MWHGAATCAEAMKHGMPCEGSHVSTILIPQPHPCSGFPSSPDFEAKRFHNCKSPRATTWDVAEGVHLRGEEPQRRILYTTSFRMKPESEQENSTSRTPS